MIDNFHTNKVYFAKGLTFVKYLDVATRLVNVFHHQKIAWGMLPQTSSPLHIWARDYMPVQVRKDKLVRFCYAPDYLRESPEYKPDISAVLSELGIEVIDSDIVLDGGNVVSCGDKVILTDKIIRENPHYEKSALIHALNQLLEAEVVLIPQDVYDEYGHADGMVRYMGEGRVLLNNYCDFDKALRKKLLSALKAHFEISELHYGTYTDKSWAYINFLHVGQHIFIPTMEDKLIERAFRQITEAFPECECHSIWGCGSIVQEGGALNCTTWNVLMDLPIEEESKELPKPSTICLLPNL
jgi:agmatine/peptidylarginine deiminase